MSLFTIVLRFEDVVRLEGKLGRIVKYPRLVQYLDQFRIPKQEEGTVKLNLEECDA